MGWQSRLLWQNLVKGDLDALDEHLHKYFLEPSQVSGYKLKPSKAKKLKPSASFGPSLGENTVLHLVCKHGLASFLDAILASCTDVHFDIKNHIGDTPLHTLLRNCKAAPKADESRLKMARQLMEQMTVKQCDVVNSDGETVLHMAARKGRLGLFKDMIIKGAGKKLRKNKRGRTPMDVAEEKQHIIKVMEGLMDTPNGIPLIRQYAQDPNHSYMYLIHFCKQTNPNAVATASAIATNLTKEQADLKDTQGNTALHYCVKNNHQEIIQLLLRAHASFVIPNEFRQTAWDWTGNQTRLLFLATPYGRSSLVEYHLNRQETVQAFEKYLKWQFSGLVSLNKSQLESLFRAISTVADVALAERALDSIIPQLKIMCSPVALKKLLLQPLVRMCARTARAHLFFPVARRLIDALDRRDLDSVVDGEGNTLLHLAARHGLVDVCKYLVSQGAGCVENKAKLTPQEVADHAEHKELASALETAHFFNSDKSERQQEADYQAKALVKDYQLGGLDMEQIGQQRNSLMKEVIEVLGVGEDTADTLLQHYEWDKETLIDAWLGDMKGVCTKAGVLPPGQGPQLEDESSSTEQGEVDEEEDCQVCYANPVIKVSMPCRHNTLCELCWGRYLDLKIKEAQVSNIMCPDVDCAMRVPADLVRRLASPALLPRYERFNLSSFVKQNPNVKWCPAAGCENAISRTNNKAQTGMGLLADCGNGHMSCFECGSDPPHEPCSCELWARWQSKLEEVKGEEKGSSSDIASRLWIRENTKPCPKCKAKILKNEGCNHMTCKNCKNEFCWICMEAWAPHGNSYFKCSRWKGEGPTEAKMISINAKVRQKQLERFLHYYDHYNAHLDSWRLEQGIRGTSIEQLKQRLQANTRQIVDVDFLSGAFMELALSRLVLLASYALRFFMDDKQEKQASSYETLQQSMAQACERLSNCMARKILRATRPDIIEYSVQLQRQREAFLFQSRQVGLLSENEMVNKFQSEVKADPSTDPTTFGVAVAGAGQWVCSACTFVNVNNNANCTMCNTPKPTPAQIATAAAATQAVAVEAAKTAAAASTRANHFSPQRTTRQAAKRYEFVFRNPGNLKPATAAAIQTMVGVYNFSAEEGVHKRGPWNLTRDIVGNWELRCPSSPSYLACSCSYEEHKPQAKQKWFAKSTKIAKARSDGAPQWAFPAGMMKTFALGAALKEFGRIEDEEHKSDGVLPDYVNLEVNWPKRQAQGRWTKVRNVVQMASLAGALSPRSGLEAGGAGEPPSVTVLLKEVSNGELDDEQKSYFKTLLLSGNQAEVSRAARELQTLQLQQRSEELKTMEGLQAPGLMTQLTNTPSFRVEQRVVVRVAEGLRCGTIKYLGEATSIPFYGVRMDTPIGKNNGTTIKGEFLFSCEDKHGLFVRPERLCRVEDWKLPMGWDMSLHNGVPFYANHKNRSTTWDDPRSLPPGWIKLFDKKSKTTYFSNSRAKKTQWVDPRPPVEGLRLRVAGKPF